MCKVVIISCSLVHMVCMITFSEMILSWTFSFFCGLYQEQASWVCQCDDNMVQRLETDFKMTLQQQSTLEQWAAWLDNVMMQALKPYEGRPSFPKAARQFLLKWSFYRYHLNFSKFYFLYSVDICLEMLISFNPTQ